MQRLCNKLVTSFHNSLDAISQSWFPKVIMTTFYGEEEIRHSGESRTDYLICTLINESLLFFKAPESEKESV